MSRLQNNSPVHAWVSRAGEGQARTACGAVVLEEFASRDVMEITCRHHGCVAEAQEMADRRLKGMETKPKWITADAAWQVYGVNVTAVPPDAIKTTLVQQEPGRWLRLFLEDDVKARSAK